MTISRKLTVVMLTGGILASGVATVALLRKPAIGTVPKDGPCTSGRQCAAGLKCLQDPDGPVGQGTCLPVIRER